MKTLIRIVMLMAIIAIIMAGCGNGNNGGSGGLNIDIGGSGGDDQSDDPEGSKGSGESDSDDSGSSGGSGGSGGLTGSAGPNAPTVPDLRLVSYISAPYEECLAGGYWYYYDEENRLIKVVVKADMNNGTWEVSYPTEATIQYDNIDYPYSFTLTYGDDGLVTIYEGDTTGMPIHVDIEYENGYVAKSVTTGAPFKQTLNFFWSGDQLDTLENAFSSMSLKTHWTYGDIPNVECSIMPWVPSHQKNWYGPTYFFGNMPPYLPATEKRDIDGASVVYRYETDKDGYVENVYIKVNGGEEILYYEIEYYD